MVSFKHNVYYTIEKLEGTTWVPRIQYNYESLPDFVKFAKLGHRIIFSGKDITSKYLENIEHGVKENNIKKPHKSAKNLSKTIKKRSLI